jgi:hypothetical protein
MRTAIVTPHFEQSPDGGATFADSAASGSGRRHRESGNGLIRNCGGTADDLPTRATGQYIPPEEPHPSAILTPSAGRRRDGDSLAPTEYGRRPSRRSPHDRRFCAKNRAERGWWSRNGDHGTRVSAHREERTRPQPIQTAQRYSTSRTTANSAGDTVDHPLPPLLALGIGLPACDPRRCGLLASAAPNMRFGKADGSATVRLRPGCNLRRCLSKWHWLKGCRLVAAAAIVAFFTRRSVRAWPAGRKSSKMCASSVELNQFLDCHARPPEHAHNHVVLAGLWLQPAPPTSSYLPAPACPAGSGPCGPLS